MGFDLQALRRRVRERLLAESPDHLLVVENEPGLREIIRRELEKHLGMPTQSCSLDEFVREPGLAIGAQILVANHLVETIKPLISSNRPAMEVVYSLAAEHVNLINQLQNPSIISIASSSESLLRTAKSIFASAIKRRHVLHEVLVKDKAKLSLVDSDLIFCDTVTIGMVRARNKVHYQLIAQDCFSDLTASLNPEFLKIR